MSANKMNSLLGLVGYGDSDDETEDDAMAVVAASQAAAATSSMNVVNNAAVHPAPIPHCPWSACYDETSGFTYYWNHLTNAVTWEAPPEYMLALKVVQQQMHTSGTTEVSAEEWQMYQQALAEKQHLQRSAAARPAAAPKPVKTNEKLNNVKKVGEPSKKRPSSDDEDEKIELITYYSNSDSDSNDETLSPVKKAPSVAPRPTTNVALARSQTKKKKAKPSSKAVEYGPSLPPNQNYAAPIGPELPPELMTQAGPKSPDNKTEIPVTNLEVKTSAASDSEDNRDELKLLEKLKDKAKLLEKLGGEVPSEIQKIFKDKKPLASPVRSEENSRDSRSIDDVDNLLNEIEKNEFPKLKKKVKSDSGSDRSPNSIKRKSPESDGATTPPLEEIKALFPSAKLAIKDTPLCLFPSADNIKEDTVKTDPPQEPETLPAAAEKKPANIYLMDSSEVSDKPTKKKRRIDNSVLPQRKVSEVPSYTTKYSQYIEGFSCERTGLGFSNENDGDQSPKKVISYGNGLAFTKGEVLNEEKKDEELDDMSSLLEAKLKFLCQQQLDAVSPVQEMYVQMQTLVGAWAAGALSGAYWRAWLAAGRGALARLEAQAAPPGWTCAFLRSEGRYQYRRDADGLLQWEYPAVADTDMEICTTPPPPPDHEAKQEEAVSVAAPAPAPAPASASAPAAAPPPPPPPLPVTPPPPAWADPPPPGCDDVTPAHPAHPAHPALPAPVPPEPKKEITDELMSFYSDIAELERDVTSTSNSPEPPPPPPPSDIGPLPDKDKVQIKEASVKASKKKSKVKISSSMGMKHKSVSSMVAKWQQVANEINND